MTFGAFNYLGTDPWLGFTISFPRGAPIDTEDDGFGVCYEFDRANSKFQAMLSTELTVSVMFPRGQYLLQAEDVDEDLKAQLPEAVRTAKGASFIKVELGEGANVMIRGFGLPFSNPGHPSEQWLLKGAPIVGNIRLEDIFKLRAYHVLVPLLASSVMSKFAADKVGPAVSYPYGEEHTWDLERYDAMLPNCRGQKFEPAPYFNSDDKHVAVVTQSEVQDIWWLYKVAEKVKDTALPTYLVPLRADVPRYYYAIMRKPAWLHEAFGIPAAQIDPAWRRLTKLGQLVLHMGKPDGADGGDWDAQIVESPRAVHALQNHRIDNNLDLVFLVRRPIDPQSNGADFQLSSFDNRNAANDALRHSVAA